MRSTPHLPNLTRLAVMFTLIISLATLGAGCSSQTSTTVTTSNTTSGSVNSNVNTDVDASVPLPTSSQNTNPSTAPATSSGKGTTASGVSVNVNVNAGVTLDTKSAYKDGTYSATGNYTSPAGAEHVPVTLTLTKDVVTDVSVSVTATNPKSKYMQQVFVDNYKTQVVGKNIASLSLGKISGSSLTPQGFNDAVTKIKAQAAL